MNTKMNTMFKDKVSVFKNYYSEPETITLGQWIKACKEGSRFTKQVLEYRQTGDERLKKSLPMITVGAVCTGGRKLEDVTQRTGWIALDIDGKDNPDIGSADILRDEVSKITNVAFAGLSTGGKGVWVLVKVSDPSHLSGHFSMLLKDFKDIGITLDRSKGRNPNDARFYSYDPNAVINETLTIYTKQPRVSPNQAPLYTPKNPLNTSVEASVYARSILMKELEILSQAQKGERNSTLFKCAAQLGELAAGGSLLLVEVHEALKQIALGVGLHHKEVEKTIQSGIQRGLLNPRVLQKLP